MSIWTQAGRFSHRNGRPIFYHVYRGAALRVPVEHNVNRFFHESKNLRIIPVNPLDISVEESEDVDSSKEHTKRGSDANNNKPNPNRFSATVATLKKCAETAAITVASVAVLAAAGLTYHEAYEWHVLDKVSKAFDVGDTSFDLAIHETATDSESNHWVQRPQQKVLDDIVSGKIKNRYFLLIGEKGTGKTSLVLESFSKVGGKNCTAMDAHADTEIFRIRLGKALNFEFFENYIGSLFSIRGPRDTSAILDIERAFGKLEEVAIRRVKKTGSPLVLFINSAHLIRENEVGVQLVELLQQKAEELSGSGLVTMIFNSDDYWLYERMRKLGTKLEVINVTDLNRPQAIEQIIATRQRHFDETPSSEVAEQIYDLIGGRPQHLSQVVKHRNMLVACHEIIDQEKTWFLNKCGLLGATMDDDVMESGKFSVSAMLLAQELVRLDNEQPKDHKTTYQSPSIPLWRARQVMTRPDYIQKYDDMNIFTIDSKSHVKADSVPMMRAFHEIVSQPGFEELLTQTADRVAAIESLGRTRELALKDLALGGHYTINNKGNKQFQMTLHGGTREDDDDQEPEVIPLQDLKSGSERHWWERRMRNDYITTFADDDTIRGEVDQRKDLGGKDD